MDVARYIVAFFLMVVLDYGWAKYISNIADKKALLAASWAVVIYVVGAVLVLLVVEDRAILIPASLGTFIGTYVAVKVKREL